MILQRKSAIDFLNHGTKILRQSKFGWYKTFTKLSVLLALLAFSPREIFAQNLLSNGSLDTWAGTPSLPTGWTHELSPSGVTCTLTADTGFTGTYSAKINCTAYTFIDGTSHADLFQEGFALTNGATYAVSFYAKGDSSKPKLRIWLGNTSGTYVPLLQYVNLTTYWQHYIFYVPVTQDVTSANSVLWFTMDQVGTTWIDGVVLQDKNLISNGSFESWSGGLPVGWGHDADQPGVTSTVASDTGTIGSDSCKVTCTAYPTPAPSIAPDVYEIGFNSDLQVGVTYNLSFWAKSATAGTTIYSSIWDHITWATPAPFQQSLALTTSWTKYSYSFTPTVTVPKANGLFWLELLGVGTVWYDNVQLQEAVSQYGPAAPVVSGATNLIPNSGFEAGTGNWGTLGLTAGWGANPVGLTGTLDTASPHEGVNSLRIDVSSSNVLYYDNWQAVPGSQSLAVPQSLVQTANSGWISVNPAQQLTFSAYLKASTAGVPVRLSIITGNDPASGDTPGLYSTNVSVGTTWQRYTFTTYVPTSQVYVAVGPDYTGSSIPSGTTSVWVDAVQLEQASSASTYQRQGTVELAINGNAFGNIYTIGQTPTFTIGGSNSTGSSSTITVTAQLTDYFGNSLTPQTSNVTILPGSTVSSTFTPTFTKQGYYRIHFSWSIGGNAQTKDMIMAYIDGNTAATSPFGINHAPGSSALCAALNTAGVTWARDWSLVWDNIEQTSGSTNYTPADTQIQRELSANMNVLALVPLPSTQWNSSDSHYFTPSYQPPWEETRYAPSTASDLATFIGNSVTHYASLTPGKVKYWEFMNEPLWTGFCLPITGMVYTGTLPAPAGLIPGPGYSVSDYVSLLHQSYTAIKTADSGASVVGGLCMDPWQYLLTDSGSTYLNEFITAGGLSYVDILNVHNYGENEAAANGLPISPEVIMPHLQSLVTAMGGSVKPIWQDEFAYYASDDLPWTPYANTGAFPYLIGSEEGMANWTIRSNLIMLANDVTKIFYHQGINGAINDSSWDIQDPLFTGLNNLGQPRKLYAAQAELSHFLGSAPVYGAKWNIASTISGHSTAGIYGFSFTNSSTAVMAVWANEVAVANHSTWSITVPAGVTIYDVMGNSVGSSTATLGSSPLYLVSSTYSAASLALVANIPLSY